MADPIQGVSIAEGGSGAAIPGHEIMGDPMGADQEKQDKELLDRLKKFVRVGVANARTYSKWVKRGDTLFKGNLDKKDDQQTDDSPAAPTRVNKLRRKIVGAVNQIYSRNPKFVGVPRRPIMVPADPQPVMTTTIDPMTGQPVQTPQVDPMTGQPMMAPPIDPATGIPLENDISEQVAEVVAAIMDHTFMESGFKAEAKQCALEAHNRPASFMQVGYQYDEDNQIDDVYFRWRSFKRIIIDPSAEIYHGVLRRCRFIGVRWTLRKDEAKTLKLDWDAMRDDDNGDRKNDGKDEDDETREVYQLWMQGDKSVAWLSDGASRFAKTPEPWPWQIDGYPFAILKFTEDPDNQFSKPIIIEAEGIQIEMNEMRETLENDIVCNRKMVLFDTDILSEAETNAIIGRKQKGWKGIAGLSSRANDPIRVINEDKLDQEFFQHYERNESEMDQVLGTSINEQLGMSGKTAREVEEVSKAQGTMTGAKSDILADFMNGIVRKAVQIMRQTYDEERVTKIATRDGAAFWVKWKGSEILSEVDLRVEVGSTQAEDDDTRKQVALNLFDKLQMVAGISVRRLTNDLLREFGKKNPDQYWDQSLTGGGAPGMGGPAAPAPQMQAPAGNTSPVDVRSSLAGQMSPAVQGV